VVTPKRALSKNPVIYHRGERRARRVFRLFQSLASFSGAFAFSVCSAVKFKDLAISLENLTVPPALHLKSLLHLKSVKYWTLGAKPIAGISINSMKGYNIKGGGKKWLR